MNHRQLFFHHLAQTSAEPIALEIVKAEGIYQFDINGKKWIIDKNGVIRARFDGGREWSNATVVQYLEHLRGGGFCEVEARDGKFVGKEAQICDAITGG